jgi:NADH-ubiquinone oxidoreductase chain 2
MTNFSFDYLKESLGMYNGLFKNNVIIYFFNIFILFSSILILQFTSFFEKQVITINWFNNLKSFKLKNKIINKNDEKFQILEYPLIILLIILGMMCLISSNDIISMFLSIELQSYGLYLLSTLYRNSENSTLSGLTYFLLGGLASCFILLGSALIYINTGMTNFDDIFIISSTIYNEHNIINNNLSDNLNIIFLMLSLTIIMVGYLFKISAAPFHFWSPSVYDGVPTIVTSFISILPKISILIFILQLIHNNNYSSNIYELKLTLLISSFLSLIIGTIAGLSQNRIKKLLAYSTISHIGFMLLAITVNNIDSIQAFFFYLIQYTLSNINIFFILISIGYYKYFFNKKKSNIKDENNSPIQFIDQFKGYVHINPLIALSFAINLFSLTGIPPLIGFFGKQMVLYSSIQKGYIFISFIAIITSVISAVYYLNIIKKMFFEYKNVKKRNIINLYKTKINTNYQNKIIISSYLSIVISILTLIILLYIFYPEKFFFIIILLSLSIFNN